ncbi:NAD(P)-dependent alcohol dehydrogenase [Aquimarina sediminis]|uniref:NAD(P)-dependent alcohol dehydrogenase n=1 Tax=Aquimarina sediminis TaxID=2070536 RepID=UPI000CA02452|nr:NAD(P)-dependent alcohol dehydrogenase [Aquimarina sediminis]
MKTIVYYKYGSPDVLKLEELQKPVPKDNELLIKVKAASINPLDRHNMRGYPFLTRLVSGFFKPKNRRLGADMAGQVEMVGKDVKEFQPGDYVFGCISRGSFSEYVCVPKKGLVPIPSNTSFETAAVVPVAAITALQGLRNLKQIESGHKVLINGASGGVGTIAVQIAKSFGAEVTGVCSTKNLKMVKSLGADKVIDYTKEDCTQDKQLYDLILDTAAYRSISDYKKILNTNGIYVLIGGSLSQLFRVLLFSMWGSITGNQRMRFMIANINKKDMFFIKKLLEEGKITPVINSYYSLNEVPQAIQHFEKGHMQGKIIIQV